MNIDQLREILASLIAEARVDARNMRTEDHYTIGYDDGYLFALEAIDEILTKTPHGGR